MARRTLAQLHVLRHSFSFLLAGCFQFMTWSWWRSFSASFLVVPLLGLLPVIPPLSTCFVILCSGSLCTCSNRRNPCTSASVRCWSSSLTDPLPLFHRLSSRILSFVRFPAFISLFGSSSKVHCHRGWTKNIVNGVAFLLQLICLWLTETKSREFDCLRIGELDFDQLCSMWVLRKGGMIDEFLEQSFLVFLDRRGVRYCDGGDSEITRESTTTFESRQNAFIVVFLICVR